MPIDRAPWNALVDDDGSNVVGSVWNKAAISTVLLNPIDALVGGAWITPPFVASDYFPFGGTGTFTVDAADVVTAKYCVIGKTLFWDLVLDSVATTGSPLGLCRKIFGGFQCAHASSGLFLTSIQANAGLIQTATGAGSQINLFRDIGASAWAPAPAFSIRASGTLEIV